jgi:FAD-dependent urate hydroxylase
MNNVTTNNASQVIYTKTLKGPLSTDCEVVVLGAGPYGLSAGMYLKSRNIDVRVFGEPMDFWANKMPKGMLLRSPREASNIAGPENAYTLDAYEAASGTKPVAPVPLETFVRYGRWFQQRLGSAIDPRIIEEIRASNGGFCVTLQDGESIRSQRVVVAAGIGIFGRKPEVFRDVPAQLVSHCYEGRQVAEFTSKRVAVIGAGQSALESAALLHEAGAQVEVIAKSPALRWIGMHKWLHQLGPISTMLYSKYDVGPAGISRLVAYPGVVSHIPLSLKDKIRVRAVRPAGSRWLPARLASVKISTSRFVRSARSLGSEVELKLDDGSERRVDHVLLGTGYDVDISKYNFLAPELVGSIRRLNGYPDLGRGFASSVPGLHFVGATAARSFGPLLYFVAGTEFASRELASYIAARKLVG